VNINQVVLGGNLTRDVEVKYTKSNTAIAQFTIANNKRWVGSNGEKKEDVSFVDCTAWGKTAENIGKFFGKGQKILVTGRLKQDTWTDKEGGKRSKIGVTVETFEFVGESKGGKNTSPAPVGGTSQIPYKESEGQPPYVPMNDDECPF